MFSHLLFVVIDDNNLKQFALILHSRIAYMRFVSINLKKKKICTDCNAKQCDIWLHSVCFQSYAYAHCCLIFQFANAYLYLHSAPAQYRFNAFHLCLHFMTFDFPYRMKTKHKKRTRGRSPRIKRCMRNENKKLINKTNGRKIEAISRYPYPVSWARLEHASQTVFRSR